MEENKRKRDYARKEKQKNREVGKERAQMENIQMENKGVGVNATKKCMRSPII